VQYQREIEQSRKAFLQTNSSGALDFAATGTDSI